MSWTYLLDGDDVSEIADTKTWTRRASRPSTGTVKFQSHLMPAAVEEGVSDLIVLDDDDDPRFRGRLWDSEDSGDENTVYTTLIFQDPMILWPKKIARDYDGDFSLPTFTQDFPQAPAMMAEIISNSIMWEGPLDLELGTVATGGPDVNARPTDWPMTLDEVRQLLLQTGFLDVIVNPLMGSSSIGTVNLYNGDYGTDRSASISFDYGTGLFNVKQFKRTISMQDVCNKLFYFLGPKCDAQHWRGNVQGDDPTLPDPPGGKIPPPSNPLGDLRQASRNDYGQLMEIRIYDDFGGDCDDDGTFGTNNDFRPFYQRMWQNESLLRARPRTLVNWTPIRGLFPDPMDVGDLVTVQAGPQVRNTGFSGTQRIYEFTVDIDKSGTPNLTNIITSADQEGP